MIEAEGTSFPKIANKFKQKVFFLMFILIPFFAFSQSSKPSWVLLEEGRFYLEETLNNSANLGKAILFFRQALFERGIYPEADFYLAQAYSREGNTTLEKFHLEKAKREKMYFSSYPLYLETLYRLAEISLLEDETFKAIDYLKEIVLSNPTYEQAFKENRLEKFNSLFLEKQRDQEGFELVFNYYRFPYDSSIKAHKLLSKIYYQLGDFDLSLNHSLFFLIGVTSHLYDMALYYEPEFDFSDLRSFISRFSHYKEIKDSLENSQFWLTYVYLGNSAYALDSKKNYDIALEIWRQVVQLSTDSLASRIALDQIQKPTIKKEINLR